ncbi:MAG: sigma-70 family RNA polymerase sigma factor [Muribaculaceae bacterium]|nr:sigma-70 family RNA polymerase sigma factor [Muribaculaceae bacterium]
MGKMNFEENRLIRSLKKGNEQAFSIIFHRYFPTLYQYSVQFLKSEAEAEDVVQESFIRLWQHREKIESEHTVKSLLFVITRNLLLTRFKQNISNPGFVDYLNYCNHLGREDHSPLEYTQFVEKVEDIIDQLPAHQARVVRMSKIKEMSNKEIAEELGINEQSVKNSLSLGLRYIRSRLMIPIIIFVSSMLIFS